MRLIPSAAKLPSADLFSIDAATGGQRQKKMLLEHFVAGLRVVIRTHTVEYSYDSRKNPAC